MENNWGFRLSECGFGRRSVNIQYGGRYDGIYEDAGVGE